MVGLGLCWTTTLKVATGAGVDEHWRGAEKASDDGRHGRWAEPPVPGRMQSPILPRSDPDAHGLRGESACDRM